MTRDQIEASVAELLTIIIGRPVRPDEVVLREKEPSWDSLKHIQLVLMLEEQFGVQFTEDEMAAFRGSQDIVHSLEGKNAA
jgi:acyl carrier protein